MAWRPVSTSARRAWTAKPRRRWWTLAGTVPYLNVITTQATLLGNEVTLTNLQGRRMAVAVLLGKQRPRLSRASAQVTS